MPNLPKRFNNQIICGEAVAVMKQIPRESIDCMVTSPPYWALRDYGVRGQTGLELDVEEYIERLCGVFDEVKRVLKASGTCWVNLGDTYSTRASKGLWSAYLQTKSAPRANGAPRASRPYTRLPSKCLLQVPGRFAIAMIHRGWVLRNEIIWHKPNAMPSSAKDRFTMDFEKIFFFVKSRRYFEQQFEQLRNRERLSRPLVGQVRKRKRVYGDAFISVINPKTAEASRARMLQRGRNKRCVWPIATSPFHGNHFAVYPAQLVEVPIKAGCPKGGVVLDPFVGSGTTALVARKLERKFIGIDINPAHAQMARNRLL